MHTPTGTNPDSPANGRQYTLRQADTRMQPSRPIQTTSTPLTIQIPPRIVRTTSTSSEVDVTTADSWSEVTSPLEPNADSGGFDRSIDPEQNVSLSSLSNLVRMNSRIKFYPDQIRLISAPEEIQPPDQMDQSTCVIHIYNRLDDLDCTPRSVDKLSTSRSPHHLSPNRPKPVQLSAAASSPTLSRSSARINLLRSSNQGLPTSPSNRSQTHSQDAGKQIALLICTGNLT